MEILFIDGDIEGRAAGARAPSRAVRCLRDGRATTTPMYSISGRGYITEVRWGSRVWVSWKDRAASSRANGNDGVEGAVPLARGRC
jgi:hypothetical protein